MFSSRAMLSVALAGGMIATGYYLRARRSTHPAPPHNASLAYVDSKICGGCHQEIARTYHATGMGRSFYRPRLENTVEDYQRHNAFYHQGSDRYYTMVSRG